MKSMAGKRKIITNAVIMNGVRNGRSDIADAVPPWSLLFDFRFQRGMGISHPRRFEPAKIWRKAKEV